MGESMKHAVYSMRQGMLWLICWLVGYALELKAQSGIEELAFPAEVVRVTQETQLSEEQLCVLGGRDTKGHFSFMTPQLLSNHKLHGVYTGQEPSSTYMLQDGQYLWYLLRSGQKNVVLRSVRTGLYLTRKAGGKLGLIFQKVPESRSEWLLTQGSADRFVLSDPEYPERSLSLYVSPGQGVPDYYFDNYSMPDSPELYIYQLAGGEALLPGSVELPSEGQRLALFDDRRVRMRDGSAAEVYDCTLLDGTLAPQPEMDVWQCHLCGGQRFTLGRQGRYLNYELKEDIHPVEWQIANGHICTVEAEPRYLCFDADNRTWHLSPASEARATAHWIPVSADPLRTVDRQGVCRLSGGWTASRLSAVSWQGVRCMDLTSIVLPLHASAFLSRPDGSNIPVFVHESAVKHLPSAWSFVVSCGAENRLLCHTVLSDGVPCYTDRPFVVGEGQMEYSRAACSDEGWQTLCLPFTGRLASATLAVLDSYVAGELRFVPADHLQAGLPGIVRVATGVPLRVVSEACTFTSAGMSGQVMRGTTTGMTLKDGQIPSYFLAPDGMSFERAAPESHLSPFRAYILLQSAVQPFQHRVRVRLQLGQSAVCK